MFPAKYAMPSRRILLWPLTAVLGAVLHLRHALYDLGILRHTRPRVSTIAIGNLALGGTGKTPMLELVLRTLHDMGPLATLSRGHGRRGGRFHEVEPGDDAARSGDEALQVKAAFPGVRVFVGTDRVKAIAAIEQAVPGVRAVVMDDALQHRRLDAGLRILLTTAQRPYCDDALVPAGTLRDLRIRAGHAQVVVVTKCTSIPTMAEQAKWRQRLRLGNGQELFFAGIAYEAPRTIHGAPAEQVPGSDTSALLFTGIAQPAPLVAHVQAMCGTVRHIGYPDHHAFTPRDLSRLAAVFGSFAAGPKTLITTAKDAARLRPMLVGSPLEGLPLVVIGMRTVILTEAERFEDLLRHHVGTHPAHS